MLAMTNPKLIVFDLDFTLWDCGGTWCDCLWPPFSGPPESVRDSQGRHVRLYSEVMPLLDQLGEEGIPLAIASRTEQPGWARQLLEMLDISERFAYQEIFPDSKLTHFQNLAEATTLPYDSMLFFDDEQRNLRDLESLGVQCVFVPNGLTQSLFDKGLQLFT